jgi:hypothetical protein
MAPTIAETGEDRHCVENFLKNYQQVCSKTMHPNPANIVVDAARNAILAALGNGTEDEAWTSAAVDKWLCPCVPNELGELSHELARKRSRCLYIDSLQSKSFC